ncbi:2-iminoacetate synthase ThiH [bacterium]|nr:2-iminoacetate synthase ThiH [bacterium]
MSFRQTFDWHDWNDIHNRIYSQSSDDVERALQHTERDLLDFMALVSPAAAPYLPVMLEQSRSMTQQHFGKRIQLYAPLYLSNFCDNGCVYCGYRIDNRIQRITLNADQIVRELRVLIDHGIRNILLLTGESKRHADSNYLAEAVKLVRLYFNKISIEVQPLTLDEYAALKGEGVNGVYIYQETYRRENYRFYHPKGMKSHFYYRLETPDRIALAGIEKIGLGTLIGLEDWRTDAYFTALHLHYIEETYPHTRRSISFPRLRPAESSIIPNVTITDQQLLQLMCAYRLCHPNLEMSLSTREQAHFRDEAFAFGVTSLSAGSKTNPGGYALFSSSLEQFEISDNRSPKQIATMLKNRGYEAIWDTPEFEYDIHHST